MNDNSTLSAGKYQIELTAGATQIYVLDEESQKHWVAATTDPTKAMDIVEGLIMVEVKRFYHPESKPTVANTTKPTPPFLRKSGETS